jgi:hypothetical protein
VRFEWRYLNAGCGMCGMKSWGERKDIGAQTKSQLPPERTASTTMITRPMNSNSVSQAIGCAFD